VNEAPIYVLVSRVAFFRHTPLHFGPDLVFYAFGDLTLHLFVSPEPPYVPELE